MINARPSPAEMKSRLEKIRDQYYPDLDLRTTDVVFYRGKSCAGRCCRNYHPSFRIYSFTIKISTTYHDVHGWGDELDRTLAHELIHVALPREGHGSRFKWEMQRVGAERYCKNSYDAQAKKIYRCLACKHQFEAMSHIEFCPRCDDMIECLGELEV